MLEVMRDILQSRYLRSNGNNLVIHCAEYICLKALFVRSATDYHLRVF